jgi:hypothetical protein
MGIVEFSSLRGSDLVVDCIYRGGSAKNSGDDPISKLVVGAGNQGGFRPRTNTNQSIENLKFLVLYTSGGEPEWPDTLDIHSGIFAYYGDNRNPGSDLHATAGNKVLRAIFGWGASPETRHRVPPILIFEKAGTGRDVIFRGLAVPGGRGISAEDGLIALWKTKDGRRFQNYRALFTILDVSVVSGRWVSNLKQHGNSAQVEGCPDSWKLWTNYGEIKPLLATRVGRRSKKEQLPQDVSGEKLLENLRKRFQQDPYAFEECAVELWRILAPRTGRVDVTRPWRDGGRDAVGVYKFGPVPDPLEVDFALEAKLYGKNNGVGVKEMSRLISRLRYRQFGVFVTTSYFADQAYKEVRDDGHPIALITGGDIVEALRKVGVYDETGLDRWINQRVLVPRNS